MSRSVVLVWTTFGDESAAQAVTRALAEERLIACGQLEMTPVRSVYRWEGEVQEANECRVLLKTTAAALPRLRARLLELHSYEVPEFVVLDAEASEAYATWVEESCS
jgi:periplasmic divalent cation tolerance protein